MDKKTEQMYYGLIRVIKNMGYPEEFGELVAVELGTEKTMQRMISYLVQYQPKTMEEIVDEMLSIKEEFARYRRKKEAEYYNYKYTVLLNEGLGEDEDEEEDDL